MVLGFLLLGGCSSTPPQTGGSDSRYGMAEPPPIPARLTLAQANDVTLYAISLVGTPYRYGGNTPASGFDCSGLIGHVYKSRAGVTAPRTVAALVDWGQPVPPQSLRTGDLVVFTQKGVTNHAGIYVGEGRFVHAPSTGGEVRLEALNSKYWSKQQVSYRRP
ncbi:MAG: C40 family peptidase [Rhodoferax sp.]|nr:C40 family peptidase [Rhodoferax sp.]